MSFLDPVDPKILFFVSSPITGIEDRDVLVQCPVTDPGVSNYTLINCHGKPLPEAMVLFPDPQKGITIKNLQREFRGCYQCVAQQNGAEKKSEKIQLFVRPGNASFHVN